jgi:N6-L-threonylcarbamoyladenine synthase
MYVLGIETSCDETAAAIVSGEGEIRASLVLSQIKEHKTFGGVVPEIAARSHLDHLDTLIRAAMTDAKINFSDLSAVAATCGPGLIGGVLVGMMAGKAIASARNIPFIAVNHLEGHALTPRLTDKVEFPYLLLLISGGHTQILVAEGVGQYKRWGTTLDDAAGECFDKSAKLMGLPYPGGPNVEKLAALCKDHTAALKRFDLPRPMLGRKELDFSYSGLKTAVRNYVEALPEGILKQNDVADLCFALQTAMAETLADRCARALEKFIATYAPKNPALVVSGGVAANLAIRAKLETAAAKKNAKLYAPPVHLCSDNAAMIAWAGLERLRLGLTDGLDVMARPRWPLDPSAEPRHGAGVKA